MIYDFLLMAMKPEFVIVVLVAVSAFATVIMLGAPLFANDKLGTRMKHVADEREKLKAQRLKEMSDEQQRKGSDFIVHVSPRACVLLEISTLASASPQTS